MNPLPSGPFKAAPPISTPAPRGKAPQAPTRGRGTPPGPPTAGLSKTAKVSPPVVSKSVPPPEAVQPKLPKMTPKAGASRPTPTPKKTETGPSLSHRPLPTPTPKTQIVRGQQGTLNYIKTLGNADWTKDIPIPPEISEENAEKMTRADKLKAAIEATSRLEFATPSITNQPEIKEAINKIWKEVTSLDDAKKMHKLCRLCERLPKTEETKHLTDDFEIHFSEGGGKLILPGYYKEVLSAESDFFKTLFRGGFIEGKQRDVKMGEIDKETFQNILTVWADEAVPTTHAEFLELYQYSNKFDLSFPCLDRYLIKAVKICQREIENFHPSLWPYYEKREDSKRSVKLKEFYENYFHVFEENMAFALALCEWIVKDYLNISISKKETRVIDVDTGEHTVTTSREEPEAKGELLNAIEKLFGETSKIEGTSFLPPAKFDFRGLTRSSLKRAQEITKATKCPLELIFDSDLLTQSYKLENTAARFDQLLESGGNRWTETKMVINSYKEKSKIIKGLNQAKTRNISTIEIRDNPHLQLKYLKELEDFKNLKVLNIHRCKDIDEMDIDELLEQYPNLTINYIPWE